MIQPIDSQVLIKPEPIKEIKLASGIILTNPRTKTRKGEVISIGKDVEEVKIGDVVEFFTIHNPEIDGNYIVDTSLDNCRIICKYN
jgi:co-chaperonin GroES (HSP10)